MSFAVIVLIVVAVCCLPASHQQPVDFQSPDVTALVHTDRGPVHVEAYRVTPARSGKKNALHHWVSLGAPRIVQAPHLRKRPDNSTSVSDAFEFEEDRVRVWIGFLSPTMKSALAKAAKEKHGEKHVQINPIRPSHVNCSLEIAGDRGTTHVLNGSKMFTRQLPFRVNFPVDASSRARQILQERVSKNSTDGVSLKCTFQVQVKKDNAETLPTQLTLAQKKQVWGKMFSKNGPVVMTFKQLRWLGQQVQDIESSSSSSSSRKTADGSTARHLNAFVNRTLLNGSSEHRSVMGIDDALALLSTYKLNTTDASVIKRDLNTLFEVDRTSGFIGFNQTSRDRLLREGVLSSTPRASKKLVLHGFIRLGSLEDVLDGKDSANMAEQLVKMNKLEDSDVVWQSDGDAVVAGKLRVVQLFRPMFKGSGLFRFNRHLQHRVSFSQSVDVSLKLEDNKKLPQTEPTNPAA